MNEMKHRFPVFDLHSDIPIDIVRRRAQGERAVFKNHHFDRMLKNGIRAAIFTLWVEPAFRSDSPTRLLAQLGALLADFTESAECVELVTDLPSLFRCVHSNKIAVILGVEGMTFVEQWPVAHNHPSKYANTASNALEELTEKYLQSISILTKSGLRHGIFVWSEQNEIASGPGRFFDASGRTGLTTFGEMVVRDFRQKKIIIDISHLDEHSAEDVFNTVDGVVIASHSNARTLCNHPRNLPDHHLHEIGQRNGVIGINTYPSFIDPSNATLDRYIDHIVYISSLIGIEHVALGFDFTDFLPDTLGFPDRTEGLKCVEDVPNLIWRLSERGFTDHEIEQIAFANSVRMIVS